MLLAISDSPELTSTNIIFTVICALALALVHIYACQLKFLDSIPRSRWLSMASGVSVAYVFIHLLPDLGEQQEFFTESEIFSFIEHHVYLMALIGLVAFYGLERMVTESQRQENCNEVDAGIYWIHIISFALYNALIGYLLFPL